MVCITGFIIDRWVSVPFVRIIKALCWVLRWDQYKVAQVSLAFTILFVGGWVASEAQQDVGLIAPAAGVIAIMMALYIYLIPKFKYAASVGMLPARPFISAVLGYRLAITTMSPLICLFDFTIGAWPAGLLYAIEQCGLLMSLYAMTCIGEPNQRAKLHFRVLSPAPVSS